MIKVKEIIELMEDFAPINLKEDFDNVGLMVGDKDKEVSKMLLALDCTLDVIEEAKENNVDLIITHHPLIFRKPSSITTETLQGKKIIELIKNDISLYSSHTNLDSAKGGINQTITEILGYNNSRILDKNKYSKDDNVGLGRIVELEHYTEVEDLIKNVKEKLGIKNLRCVKGTEKIHKIAIINGSGESFIAKAVLNGANCIITGDTTYHFASDYKEMGVSIIDIGHFESEWKVFVKIMKNILKSLNNIEVIVSQKAETPYKFL